MFDFMHRLSQDKRLKTGFLPALLLGNMLQIMLMDHGFRRAAGILAASEGVLLAALLIFYLERSRRCLD